MELTKKNSAFYVTFIFSEGNFFNVGVLSQCIVFWINFQNRYTFTYQKTLFYTLLMFGFKIVESLQCIPNYFITFILLGSEWKSSPFALPPWSQADYDVHLLIFGFDKLDQIPPYFKLTFSNIFISLHITFSPN